MNHVLDDDTDDRRMTWAYVLSRTRVVAAAGYGNIVVGTGQTQEERQEEMGEESKS